MTVGETDVTKAASMADELDGVKAGEKVEHLVV